MSPHIIKIKQRNDLIEHLQEQEDYAWKRIRGMWKNKKIHPLRYQKKLRKEADRHVK